MCRFTPGAVAMVLKSSCNDEGTCCHPMTMSTFARGTSVFIDLHKQDQHARRVCHASDKENFVGDHATEVISGWPRRPSEKQKQLEYEQCEMVRHHNAKVQKMRERDRHHQLVKEGSENDTNEELAEDEQSDSDNEDNRFTSHEVLTKLSEATNERLTYREGKVPKPSNAVILSVDHISLLILTRGQTDTTDEELDEESHSMSRTTQTSSDHLSSSDHQSSKHKRSKERHGDHRTSEAEDTVDRVASDRHLDKQKKSKGVHVDRRTPELEDTADYATQPTRQRRAAKEDLAPAMVKVQKLTSHDGRPHARDFDDVTQEFMATVIREYRARLLPFGAHKYEDSSHQQNKQVQTLQINRPTDP
ncbi:hypothetical protein EDD15DRAFT_2196652 [Pisolithus albus]|nr:hypothetical protein EDD15DRAFT_2196652 [Pisolithus albus]